MTQDQPSTEELEAQHWPVVVWAARLSVYFLAQGALVLLDYAYFGFGRDPDSFALGFRIDPILAAVYLVWGLIGTYVGFFQPRYATAFVLAFAAFFTLLAALGSFTQLRFGMTLVPRIDLFHWAVAALAWAIGLYALRHRRG
jgi:hypothetical protein